MIPLIDKLEDLTSHLKEYIQTTIALMKMKAAEKLSILIADATAFIIVLMAFAFFLAFASFSLAYYLSIQLGSQPSGFLIVAGIYLLIAIVIWLGKDRFIRRGILKAIISRIFENENNNGKHQ